jgi:signal transduction histidine kinase
MSRLLYAGIALLSVLFLLADSALITAQAEYLHPLWQAIAIGTLAGLPALIGIAARFVPLKVVRALVLVDLVAFLVALFTWLPAVTTALPHSARVPWLFALASTTASFAAVALSQTMAWVATAAIGIGLGIVGVLADGGSIVRASGPLDAAIFRTGISVVLVAIVLVTLHAARVRDAAAAQTARELAHSSAVEARTVARSRAIAFIHDTVIVALVAAARYDRSQRSHVRELATSTLTRLRAPLTSTDSTTTATPSDLAALLRAVADRLDARIVVSVSGDEATLNSDAFESLLQAASEAMRNASRHAGADATVRVSVDTADGATTVTVEDDGVGFDLRRDTAERFGVDVSIIRRMEQLPGGSSAIHTAPGEGTRVVLRYEVVA